VASVVVDTSVWVEFFAGRRPKELVEALENGVVWLPAIVVSELISGAGTAEQREEIGELLQEVAVIETNLEHWIHVGDLRRTLRARGVTVSVPDAHVAQCAIERNAVLLTRDRVFTRIANHTWLRLG